MKMLFAPAKAASLWSVHCFGSWILDLVLVSGFVVNWQYVLRGFFRTRPRKPLARSSLRVSLGHPESKMLCVFLSGIKYVCDL